jgi:FixJ family two-component response regulator
VGALRQVSETVQVVDDDPFTLAVAREILAAAGYAVQTFGSPGAYLAAEPLPGLSCTLLDLNMPEIDGLTVLGSIMGRRDPPPVIILSGYTDVPTSVRAMKGGAMDYLCKPVSAPELISVVRRGLDLHAVRRRRSTENDALRLLFAQLTSREREICEMAASGLLNKQIADALGLHERTVKLHRSEGMRKLRAASLPDLVRLFDRISQLGPDGAR